MTRGTLDRRDGRGGRTGEPRHVSRPAAAGEICDLKISLNDGPPNDGGFEFYRREELFLSGAGWPLATMLDLRVLANDVEVHQEELPVQSDGTVARVMGFIGFLVDDADAPAEMRITVSNPADPGGCSDVVDLVRLPDPPFDDIVFDPFRESIIWLHDQGLVAGCRPRDLLREQPHHPGADGGASRASARASGDDRRLLHR